MDDRADKMDGRERERIGFSVRRVGLYSLANRGDINVLGCPTPVALAQFFCCS